MSISEMKFRDFVDEDIICSDEEIRELAKFSHNTEATITEEKSKNSMVMTLELNKNEDIILVASSNRERYKELSNDFFKKFIKYGGNIDLADVFLDE